MAFADAFDIADIRNYDLQVMTNLRISIPMMTSCQSLFDILTNALLPSYKTWIIRN